MVIVSLGVLRPDTWTLFLVGGAAALALAGVLSVVLPRMYVTDWGRPP